MRRIMLCVFILSCTLIAQNFQNNIEVNGTSEILAQADYINFVINIKNITESLEDSRKNNLEASTELKDIFIKFNIPSEDWELTPLKFGKEYTYTRDERKFVGYFAQSKMTIKLKQLDKYYDFISHLSKNTLFEITHSDYGVSNILKYHKQATIDAAKAARNKAEYIAESMGVKIGKVLEIIELNQFESYPNPFNTISVMAKSPEDISGKVSISRSVKIH
ncbi:MAG: SIMPL domain-containing protein [Melioribacteraceae bacterium]|nr:SIMPL domain-containing protein [Melioribacteraceae bacterium]